jgi:ABC-type transport system substrate-binding protein
VNGFLPAGIPGHDHRTMGSGQDLEQARRLITEAGYPGGRGLPSPLRFAARIGRDEERLAQFLAASFAEIGAKVEYRTFALETLVKDLDIGRFPMIRFGWTGYYTPDGYLYPLFHSSGALPRFGYANPELDLVLEQARQELDPDRRRQLYHQAEVTIINDAPCVSLVQPTTDILLRQCWEGIPIGYIPEHLEIELARFKEGS